MYRQGTCSGVCARARFVRLFSRPSTCVCRCWALALFGGNSETGFDQNTTYSIFSISITLTDEGFQNFYQVKKRLHLLSPLLFLSEKTKKKKQAAAPSIPTQSVWSLVLFMSLSLLAWPRALVFVFFLYNSSSVHMFFWGFFTFFLGFSHLRAPSSPRGETVTTHKHKI